MPSLSYITSLATLLIWRATAEVLDPTIESQPDEKQGWYSSPNYRSTLDIIWPCLFTTFLCCWTAIHPNITYPSSTWRHFWDRTACLFLGVVVPEFAIYTAMNEHHRARESFKKCVEVLGKDNWSITHGFYAEMGGFAVRPEELNEPYSQGPKIQYALPGGICYLFERGQIDSRAWITEAEIKDKGKADGFLKTLALSQILWLCVQCIARLAQGLPLATIEVAALAYIPCALFLYFIWWRKPYEVNVPTILLVEQPGNSRSKYVSTLTDSPMDDHNVHRIFGHYSGTTYSCLTTWLNNTLPDAYNCWLMVALLIFGSVHLAAWNFEFPSQTERTMWRICSLLITLNGPAATLCILGSRYLEKRLHGYWQAIQRLIILSACASLALSYIGARMYLVVEVFFALRAAPKSVYKTPEWTNFLFHAG